MGDSEDKEKKEEEASEETNEAGSSGDRTNCDIASPARKRRAVDTGDDHVTTVSPSTSSTSAPQRIDKDTIVELLKADNLSDIAKLQMLHKISTDPEYRIQRAPENPLERVVKETIHRAFWDALLEDVSRVPPELRHAVNLLLEAKQILLTDLLPPRQGPVRTSVEVRLDENTIRNQIEQDAFDVAATAKFVLDTLGKLCAPNRDEEVAALRADTTNIVQLLKGIMELMERMKDDLASFFLETHREEVVQAARAYERADLGKAMESAAPMLESVEKWIADEYRQSRKEDESLEDPTVLSKAIRRVAALGLVRIISTISSAPGGPPLPMLWLLDKSALIALAEKRLQFVLVAAAMYTFKSAKDLSEEKLNALLASLVLITNDVEESNVESVVSAMAMNCERTAEEDGDGLSEDAKTKLAVIKALHRVDQPVRVLITTRLDAYLTASLSSSSPPPLPSSSTSTSSPIPTPLPTIFAPISDFIVLVERILRSILDHNVETFKDIYENVMKKVDQA